MKVTLFAPVFKDNEDIESILSAGFISCSPLPLFDDLSIDFLSALSKRILETAGIKNYPELVALAYWLRKANLTSVITSFKNKIDDDEVLVPRGLAFHIAPSNVDSIFLYSWALSLLVGNLNVVRISQTLNSQLETLLDILRHLLSQKNWNAIAERNVVITYPRDEKLNTFISTKADVRVLWGGDETIKSIKTLPSKPAAKDILFADKFSYTIIDAAGYASITDPGKAKIAKAFYNDAYWFDQMACSSPRFVLFAGDETSCINSSKSFWEQLEKELQSKSKVDSLDIAMEKLVYLYESISRTSLQDTPALPEGNKPTVLKVNKEEIKKFRESCGGGFFFECFLKNLDELSELVSQKDQTLAYFGFSKEELKNFAEKVNGKGIDRIVPIGHALNFAPVWDGYSLLNELSKRVSIIS